MYNRKNETIYLLVFILSCLLIFFIYTEFYTSRVKSSNDSAIENGILDLSNSGLPPKKVIGLNGTCEFYWKQLLTPTDFQNDSTLKPDGFINIPGTWNNFKINNEQIKGKGYATYRFKILVKDDKQQYAIKIKEFDTAYKIWANNQHIEVGTVGKSKNTMHPSWKRQEIIFEPINGIVDVVIQISNFTHRKGGAEDRMYFGTTNNISQYKQRFVITNAFILGILIILSIYHLILFIYRHETSTGIFSLFCITIALRLLTTNEKLIFEIFPNISWLLVMKTEYISYKMALPLLVGFVHSLYPTYLRRSIIRFLFILAAFFSSIVLFTPVQFFSYTPLVYQFVLVFGAVYTFIALIKASIKNEENAIIILAGYFIFIALLANDMLYYNKIINSSFLMHYGLFILAVSQAIVLSRTFSTSYQKIEALSNELEQHNRMLEQTVFERTREIQAQKEEIEQQAESLRHTNKQLKTLTDFKENLTQMIVHDLKNPLSVVLNSSTNEQIKHAGTQMLNLVQNLLDVQRYEKSKINLNTENTSVSKLVNDAIEQFQYLIQQKSINISNHINEQHFILADKNIITRVFSNMISNSVRFTPYKGVISISTCEEESYIIFKISDNGPGIPEDQKELIFKKFGQYNSNATMQNGTSGIGLTFCKLAVEAHGGSINYKTSKENKTTFYCSLPKGDATDIGTRKTIKKSHFTDNNFSFSEIEKAALKDVVKQLKQLRIYQIGEIKQQLNCIDNIKDSPTEAWVQEIKDAVYNSDENKFNKLLNKIE